MYQILIKALVPLAMVLLLAVMACGGSEYSEPTSAPRSQATAAPAATTAPAPAATTAPAGVPPQDQPVVVVTESGQAEGFNTIGGSATVNDAPTT